MSSLSEKKIANLEKQLAELECDHQVIKIRCRKASNNALMYKRQCVRCGDLIGSWIPHDKVIQKESVEPIDDGLAANYRRSKFELSKAINEAIKENGKNDFDEWYQQYLASREWAKKRKLVFDRCHNLCEGCREKPATVAHHLTYKNVGNEFIFELIGLCRDCHERFHGTEEANDA